MKQLGFGLLLAVTGCSVTKTHRVVTGQSGPAHSGEVMVHMSGSPAPAYEEIAILQAVGHGAHANLERVVAGLKKEAQALGCNAIVNVKVDQGASTASGTGICARIPPARPMGPQPAPPAAPAYAEAPAQPAPVVPAAAPPVTAPPPDPAATATEPSGTDTPPPFPPDE